MSTESPLIALVASPTIDNASPEVNAIVRRFVDTALEALDAAGARVVLLDPNLAEQPDPALADAADGVLFLGGGDVDPLLYGHTDPVPNEYGVSRRADDYSIGIIEATIARDAPLLCICRGSQLLNVALGGDLVPDIEDHRLHRGGRGEPMFLDETVTIEPDSKIFAFHNRERLTVRSGHHQAVGRVAPALRVIARADDGIVEGTEHTNASWVVGVQWHPDDDDGDANDRREFFEGFVDVVRRTRDGA
jgi:putative glutamine amidotransferase